MMRTYFFPILLLAAGCDDGSPTTPTGRTTTFFVTSATSVTGNLGGLARADATCQRLASVAGHSAGTWRAYLSVERIRPTAIDRRMRGIGSGRVPGITRIEC